MITKTIDKTKTKVTFATLLKIDGRNIRLFYTRILATLKEDLEDYSFEEYFLWPKAAYTNELLYTKDGLKSMWHQMYYQIVASGYSQLGKWHEVCWEEIKVEDKGHYIILSDSKSSHPCAIPPASPGETRYDYITTDGRYHYGCKKDEFEGIEIIVIGKYKFPFIPNDIKYVDGKPGKKKLREQEHYTEFIEGQTYYTKFQTREKFTLYKITRLAGTVVKFHGVYETSQHLGLCPMEPSNLMKPEVKEIDYYIIEPNIMAMGLNPGDTLVPIEGTDYCEHWMEITGTKEHMLCDDQVHIKCITEKNCKAMYK